MKSVLSSIIPLYGTTVAAYSNYPVHHAVSMIHSLPEFLPITTSLSIKHTIPSNRIRSRRTTGFSHVEKRAQYSECRRNRHHHHLFGTNACPTTTTLFSSTHPDDVMMNNNCNSTDISIQNIVDLKLNSNNNGKVIIDKHEEEIMILPQLLVMMSNATTTSKSTSSTPNIIQNWITQLTSETQKSSNKPPPFKIEDTSLLSYDIFLLLNLSVSISFWVVHRVDFLSILPAFSEGSLLCICWIISGLYNGAFLYSAANGHYDMRKEDQMDKGGPKAACMLGLNTMCTTASLRIIVALVVAVLEHRPVGVANGEELIPLEIGFGLMLMSCWRMLHSAYVSNYS